MIFITEWKARSMAARCGWALAFGGPVGENLRDGGLKQFGGFRHWLSPEQCDEQRPCCRGQS
jgi:hypothetical protein